MYFLSAISFRIRTYGDSTYVHTSFLQSLSAYVHTAIHIRTYAEASFHITIQARSTNTRFTYVQSSTLIVSYEVYRQHCFWLCTYAIDYNLQSLFVLPTAAIDARPQSAHPIRATISVWYKYLYKTSLARGPVVQDRRWRSV